MTSPTCPSLRACALILQENRILLVENESLGCFYTIGGGIEPGESSEEAVLRECREETGLSLTADRLVFVQERFYSTQSALQHEIAFFYLMKPQPLPELEGQHTDQLQERLRWLPIPELKDVNLLPPFLKTALLELPAHPLHVLSRE